MPDEHALAVLQLVDGTRRSPAIVDDLAARYDAARGVIATDVMAMLQDLTARGAFGYDGAAPPLWACWPS